MKPTKDLGSEQKRERREVNSVSLWTAWYELVFLHTLGLQAELQRRLFEMASHKLSRCLVLMSAHVPSNP